MASTQARVTEIFRAARLGQTEELSTVPEQFAPPLSGNALELNDVVGLLLTVLGV